MIRSLVIQLVTLLAFFSLLPVGAQTPDQQAKSCVAYIPNLISPNGDGINDSFEIQFTCQVAEYWLRITDQTNAIVYESRDQSQAWSGRLGTIQQPEGFYRWELDYEDPRTGQAIKERGELTLVR